MIEDTEQLKNDHNEANNVYKEFCKTMLSELEQQEKSYWSWLSVPVNV